MDRDKIRMIVVGVGLFVLGIFAGKEVGDYYSKIKANNIAAATKPLRLGTSDYKFINPLLGFDTAEAIQFGEYVELDDKIQKKVRQELGVGSAEKVSVYFRDFSRGRWLGVNQDEQYTPASLLKVPVMMEYYKLSESNPNILSQQIKFVGPGDINNIETIKGGKKIVQGQTYSIDELIQYMIVSSDNDALELLYSNLDPAALTKFFSDFGILLPDVNGLPQDFISPKTYALFFRVLYGSTYLNRFDSEKALELLNLVEYKDGMVAGVPSSISVGHKFGEYGTTTDNVNFIRELHDCGIVYYPNHPYLFCIMTKGSDIGNLQRIIKETSQIVYNEIESLYH